MVGANQCSPQDHGQLLRHGKAQPGQQDADKNARSAPAPQELLHQRPPYPYIQALSGMAPAREGLRTHALLFIPYCLHLLGRYFYSLRRASEKLIMYKEKRHEPATATMDWFLGGPGDSRGGL